MQARKKAKKNRVGKVGKYRMVDKLFDPFLFETVTLLLITLITHCYSNCSRRTY